MWQGSLRDIPSILIKTSNSLSCLEGLEINSIVEWAGDDAGPTEQPMFRGTKRTRQVVTYDLAVCQILKSYSDAMDSADKENDAQHIQQRYPIPRSELRWKSRQATNPSIVLFPKSANSRTLPQSPVRLKLNSPQKLYFAHPASMLKPTSPIELASPSKAAAAAATASLASIVNKKAKSGRLKEAPGCKASNSATAKAVGVRSRRVL